MTEAWGVGINPLVEADVPAAMKLKESAGWNQTEADWLRLLRLEPRGCFAATAEGGRLVGTATTTTYGRELAWVGMVLVDPSYRRRGIASRLMGAALSYLDSEGIETVKLDATPDGRHVYERLGFESELTIERWHRLGRVAADNARPEHARGEAASIVEAARLEKILELDRAAFGVDRARLVEMLIAESSAALFRSVAGGGRGYALARAGASADYVGPVVASDSETAARLLEEVLARLVSRPVYVDVNTQFEWAARSLAERGFRKQRDLIRMRRGAESGAGTSDKVFAIAGPEVG
ncbi:MAG TPA: GNAT family N-acetyltransferase [Pyrinomonadaceae bacterium]|jgi:ribosomal protein S18 acetylase RimI-like enzyme|nr:GNAT family N-acetyltransferase [Pyrinomonadaceae bacterium]